MKRDPRERWRAAITPIQRHFRRARARRIIARLPGIVGAHVVDVGGEARFWESVIDLLRPDRVTMYNIGETDAYSRAAIARLRAEGWDIEVVRYDGRTLPLAPSPDVVLLCNSVLEHLPKQDRPAFVREIRRAASRFVLQVPSPSFPIEMHFCMPFIHWLPRSLGRRLVPYSPFALVTRKTGQAFFDQTMLLPRKELRALFPGVAIEVERFCGIPKSYLLFGDGAGPNTAPDV